MEYKAISSEHEIELFSQGWEDAFSRKLDPMFAKWAFTSRNNMYAIFEDDKIIAGYCLLNNKIVYNGDIVDGALCNNVFVRQDYQGLNLFVKLSRYALQDVKEKGKQFLIGMPNRNAVPGHRRVGWTMMNQINFLEKNIVSPLSASFDENIVELNKENYVIYEQQLESFNLNIVNGRSLSVLKDSSYFKWRYINRDFVNYKIYIYVKDQKVYGYIVYKPYTALNRLHVVDIEAANEDVFRALVDCMNNIKEKFNLVNLWGSTIYHDYFLKYGFDISKETDNLIVIRPQESSPVALGDKVNIVLGDNEVF